MNSLFITYNPKSQIEQTLAIRMHTLGAVHGFNMYLPNREASSIISFETQARIQNSDWFICFSLGQMSPQVQAEIKFANQYYHDKKRIIIIYDKAKGKNLQGKIVDQSSTFYIDNSLGNPDLIVGELLKNIRESISDKSTKSETNSLLIWLGIGAGLMLLATNLSDKPKKKKRAK
jgi:hypothetical protein